MRILSGIAMALNRLPNITAFIIACAGELMLETGDTLLMETGDKLLL